MRPRGVNFRAFDSRLSTMRSSMSTSTKVSRPRSSSSTVESRPSRSMAGRKLAARPRTSSADVGLHPVRLDGARLDPGEVEDAVDEADEPVGVAADQLEALPRLVLEVRIRLRASCTGPAMRVSGVRSSWLTLAKKSDLAVSSAVSTSARCRSSWRRRSPLSAMATCDANTAAHTSAAGRPTDAAGWPSGAGVPWAPGARARGRAARGRHRRRSSRAARRRLRGRGAVRRPRPRRGRRQGGPRCASRAPAACVRRTSSGGRGVGQRRDELSRHLRAALGEHLDGHLRGDVEDTDDALTGVVVDGAVGPREVGLLGEAEAVDDEEPVLHPRRRPSLAGHPRTSARCRPTPRATRRARDEPTRRGACSRRGSRDSRRCRS